jgi:AcrR family transcriptional regulator
MSTTQLSTTAQRHARLLDCAIAAIEQHGESGLRVQEVAQEAGLSVSAIYHRFGSRQGLVEAAQERRFIITWGDTVKRDLTGLEMAITTARDQEHLRSMMSRLGSGVNGSERSPGRLRRMTIIGGSVNQPHLRQVIADFYSDFGDRTAELHREAMKRGLIRADFHPEISGAWLHAQLFGRVIGDIGNPIVSEGPTNSIRRKAIRWLYFGEPYSTAEVPLTNSDENPASWRQIIPDHETLIQLPPPGQHDLDDADIEADEEGMHSTGRRILNRVIQHLDTESEGTLRLREIAHEESLSETVIHRHFGSREGLLTAAHTERFREYVPYEPSRFAQIVYGCTTAEEFNTIFRVMIRIRLGRENFMKRRRRLNVLAAITGRPELASSLVRIMHDEALGYADALAEAQSKHWIRDDVDTLAFARWLTSMEVSQVLLEMNEIGTDLTSWTDMVIDFSTALLRP